MCLRSSCFFSKASCSRRSRASLRPDLALSVRVAVFGNEGEANITSADTIDGESKGSGPAARTIATAGGAGSLPPLSDVRC